MLDGGKDQGKIRRIAPRSGQRGLGRLDASFPRVFLG